MTGFQQTTTDASTNAIKVSLQDCLACSGCVTTAETMLLQHQSTDELLAKLQDPSVIVVASVSHQSVASLAAEYSIPMHTVRSHRRPSSTQTRMNTMYAPITTCRAFKFCHRRFGDGIEAVCVQCAHRLAGFLKGLGVSTVLSLQTARSLALVETASEFVSRFRRGYPSVPSQQNAVPGQPSCQPSSTAPPDTLQQKIPTAPYPGFSWQLPPPRHRADVDLDPQRSDTAAQNTCCKAASGSPPLPMLISACPGEPICLNLPTLRSPASPVHLHQIHSSIVVSPCQCSASQPTHTSCDGQLL